MALLLSQAQAWPLQKSFDTGHVGGRRNARGIYFLGGPSNESGLW